MIPMKRFWMLFAFLIFSSLCFSQTIRKLTQIHYNDAVKLKERELLVALDFSNIEVSKAIKEGVEKNWKFTPYRFIDVSEVETYKGDERYAILQHSYKIWIEQKSYFEDKTEAERSDTSAIELGISLGSEKNGKMKTGRVSLMIARSYPIFRYFPMMLTAEEKTARADNMRQISGERLPVSTENLRIYPYLIPLYIRDMDRALKRWLVEDRHEATNIATKQISHTFLENQNKVLGRTLYIDEYFLKGSISEERLRASIEADIKLGLKVEFVDVNKLKQAIDNEDRNVLIATSINDNPIGRPRFIQIWVRSAEDGDELASLVFKH